MRLFPGRADWFTTAVRIPDAPANVEASDEVGTNAAIRRDMNRSRFETLRRSSTRSGPLRRRGVVIVELLIWLPVLMTALMAVVEFAIMQQVNQQVALSSRYGAKIASEVTRAFAASPNLSNINQSATVNNLQSRIDTFLANAGLTASCEVRLEHNACVNNPSQVDTATPCNCSATGPGVLPAGEPPQGEAYVRVTVCVPLTGNVPNLLTSLGFNIAGRIVQHSTTYRVETNNSAPVPVIRLQTLPAGVTFGVGGPLPVTSPPTTLIRLDVDRAVAPDPISLTFDANLTTDLETPLAGLTLSWTKTGVPASGPTSGTTFTADFDVPNNIFPLDPDTVHFVQLTASDPCGGSASRTLSILVRRVN